MEKPKYTPGPWRVSGNKVDGNGYHIVSVNGCRTTEGIANANLIAAAPDLLKTCKQLLDYYNGEANINGTARIAMLTVAIEKAE